MVRALALRSAHSMRTWRGGPQRHSRPSQLARIVRQRTSSPAGRCQAKSAGRPNWKKEVK